MPREKLLSAAVAGDPEDPQLHYFLALARWQLHQDAGARAEIDAALRLRPGQKEFVDLRRQIDASPLP